MRPLPVFFGEPVMSMFGAMLFPEDLANAEEFAAKRLSKGPLQDWAAEGGALSTDQQLAYVSAVGRNGVSEELINERSYWGTAVGEITKVLYALASSHSERAGWDSAITIVLQSLGPKNPGSRSSFRRQLAQFAPALHLWGALSLRGGYAAVDDHDAFLAESLALLYFLRDWRETRHENEQAQDSYLSSDEFGPWIGWRAPPWARLPRITLSAAQLALVKPPGRPKRDRETPS